MALGGGDQKGGRPDLSRINPVAIIKQAHDQHGLKIIELPLDANYILSNVVTRPEHIRGMQALRDELGLEYTMHLPFFQLALCSFNPHVRKASIETQVETIKACEAIGGINNYVLHLASELEDSINSFNVESHYKELAWGFFMQNGYESLEEIIARTGIDPKKVCVENNEGIPFTKMYDILIEELGASICLDVGHMVLQGEESPIEFMNRWKDRVHEIHLHNVQRKFLANRVRIHDDHHGLESGVIDIPGFLAHLQKMAFSHPVLLEFMTQKEIKESIAYLKEKQFLENCSHP